MLLIHKDFSQMPITELKTTQNWVLITSVPGLCILFTFNKSGSPLSPSEGEMLIEVVNNNVLEPLVHLPTREKNALHFPIVSVC